MSTTSAKRANPEMWMGASMSGGDLFATTRWTEVLAAQDASTEAGGARANLCAAYYAPVHAYIARTAQDLGDPRDLSHEFFVSLLSGAKLAGGDREMGRFRAYLLGAVKHFLADTRDQRRALKRGAGREHVPLGVGAGASPGIDIPDAERDAPDAWFDRQWSLAILDRALAALAAAHAEQGRAEHFQLLKPWLTGDAAGLSQAEAATRLALSDSAVKVAIHRLRKRFRDLVKAEIALTATTDEEAREELCYLIDVVS